MTNKENYNATRAILAALKSGRQLSQLDCKEFMVEDMRTYVSHLKPRYQDTHDLNSEWITSPYLKRRIKRWWLTEKKPLNA